MAEPNRPIQLPYPGTPQAVAHGAWISPPRWGPPAQPVTGQFRPAGGLGTAAIILTVLVAVGFWLEAAVPATTGVAALLMLPAGVVTCCWLWRVRHNADLVDPHRQRRARAWVWFGWGVPIAAWFVPKQVIDDAARSTMRAAGVSYVPGTDRWWTVWLMTTVISGAVNRIDVSIQPLDGRLERPLDLLVAFSITLAAVLWTPLVRQISAAQDALASAPPIPTASGVTLPR